MKIAITGHRPNKLGNDYELLSPLVHWITNQILEILENQRKLLLLKGKPVDITGISGMALGIDTLYAKICTTIGIPFIAAIPFKGQGMRWSIKTQIQYGELLQKANQIFIVADNKFVTYDEYLTMPFESMSTGLVSKYMDMRNKWMVDNCDILIAVWDGSEGGTANCVRYAVRQVELNSITKQVPKESVIYQSCTIDEIIRIDPRDHVITT